VALRGRRDRPTAGRWAVGWSECANSVRLQRACTFGSVDRPPARSAGPAAGVRPPFWSVASVAPFL